jgi:hypothetical protein
MSCCACTGACRVPPYRCGSVAADPWPGSIPDPWWSGTPWAPPSPASSPVSPQTFANGIPPDQWAMSLKLDQIMDRLDKIEKRMAGWNPWVDDRYKGGHK